MAVRALTVLTRRTDVSIEHFESYWRDMHAPFGAGFPGVTSYTQHHVVGSIARGLAAPAPTIDGISDLTFDSMSDLDAAMASQHARDASADAATFIAQMRMYITEDHVVLPPRDHDEVFRSGCGAAGANRFAPGERFHRHHHARTTEILVCTEGELTVEVDGRLTVMHPGDHVAIPPGVDHAVRNDSASPADVLFVKTRYDPDDVVWSEQKKEER